VNCQDASRLVDAYVDDELTAEDASAVRAHLDTCPACGRLAADRLALGRLIRRLPYYEAPDALRTAVVEAGRRSRRTTRSLAWAAALVLAASLGGATARTVGEHRATNAIAQAVVDEHVRALRDQHVVDIPSSDQHTVKPWFLGKLDFAPPVDDLAAAGFPLAGGRLDHVDGRTIAALVYQRRKHPITVFVWPEHDVRTTTTAAQSIRGFNIRHWTAGGMSFWAVSDLNEAELDRFVPLLQR